VTNTLSARNQRLMALALLVLALVALWLGVFRPVLQFVRASADERQSAMRALSRDHALVTQAPFIRKALASLEQSPRWRRFYDTQRPDLATLQLETDLRAILKTPNSLTSMTAEPATRQGLLTRIGVKITLSIPIDHLAETLINLQSQERLLQIDSLTVQAPDLQQVDANPLLSIQAEIVGFMLTPSAART
jgi:Type II secretion system (T2SS), protein M subtype b